MSSVGDGVGPVTLVYITRFQVISAVSATAPMAPASDRYP